MNRNLGSENRYFRFEMGRALGPMTQKGIEDEIRAGRLLAFDLLFKNKSERWRPVHEFEEFREVLKTLTPTAREAQWVVLSAKSGNSAAKDQRLQQGPMSSDEVKARLSNGLISYRDFIWREGESQWRRISDLQAFNPTPVRWKPAFELPGDFLDEIDRELVSSGIEFKSESVAVSNAKIAPIAEQPPAEVLHQVEPHPIKAEDRRRSYISPGEVSSRLKISPLLTAALKAPKPKTALISASIVALLVVSFFSFYAKELVGKLRQIRVAITELGAGQKLGHEGVESYKPEAPQTQVEVVPAQPQVVPAQPQEISPPKTEADITDKVKDQAGSKSPPKAEVKIAPSDFQVEFKDGNIWFDFNGSSHFVVNALIFGEAGEILEKVSLYRKFRFRWGQDEARIKSFAELGLPDGEYRIEAQVHGLNAAGRFRVGRRDSEFQRRLAKHRKLISLPYQREKRNLVEAIESLIDLLRSGKTNSPARLKTWRKQWLREVTWSKAEGFVFPERWFRLNTWVEDLARSRVSPIELLGRLRSELEEVQRLRLFGSP